MPFHKFVGQTVNIIYINRQGKVSKRKMIVWSSDGMYLEAYCLMSKGRRLFRIKNILAIMPVTMRVG